jgi:hypothetical protein
LEFGAITASLVVGHLVLPFISVVAISFPERLR